jgi:hypothetical protein
LKKFLVILGIIGFLSIISIGYGNKSISTNNNNSLQPKQVIENYFKYYNQKNRQGLLSTLTSWHDQSNVDFGFDNLIFIKLVSIGNDDLTITKSYLIYGRGKVNGVKENNVVSYKVIYISLFSKSSSAWPSGIRTEGFTLVRESDNAPWLIDDMGQGYFSDLAQSFKWTQIFLFDGSKGWGL